MTDQKFKVIHDLINGSDCMEYLWFSQKNDIRRTGIVISFDGAQVFTLDFIASSDDTAGSQLNFGSVASSVAFVKFFSSFKKEEAKDATSVSLNKHTSLNPFSGIKLRVHGRLLKLSLTTKEEKEKAVNLFDSVVEIDVGDYEQTYNDCRSYVTTVAILLKQFAKTKDNWKAFKIKMKELVSEDQYKFAELQAYILKTQNKSSTPADQE